MKLSKTARTAAANFAVSYAAYRVAVKDNCQNDIVVWGDIALRDAKTLGLSDAEFDLSAARVLIENTRLALNRQCEPLTEQ